MFVLRRCAPLIVLGLSACIELSPIAPPAEQEAVLHLSLRLGDVDPAAGGDGALVTATATLETGVDEIGRTRGIVDDTLIVLGESLPAVDLGVGRGVYSETLLLDRQEVFGGPFGIRAPVIENLPPFAFEVRWPVLEKAEPQPVILEPGADLVLPLSFDGFPGQPAPESQRWSLAVFRQDGWFSQGADGVPPEQVVVPGTLLGAPGTAMLVILTMTNSLRVNAPPGDYGARIELAQELRWTVQVAGPTAARGTGDPGTRSDPSADPRRPAIANDSYPEPQ